MSAFKDSIQKISQLAAIKLTEQEEQIFSKEIESMLKLFDAFKEVDTEGVPRLENINKDHCHLRQDIAANPHSETQVMSSAINSKYGYFITPKFVD